MELIQSTGMVLPISRKTCVVQVGTSFQSLVKARMVGVGMGK